MIIDSTAEFCDATSVAAAAGTALVGNVIDTTDARDLGNGQPLYLIISVDTAVITGGSAGTVQFKLSSDSTAAIATDGTATDHILTPTFVTDDSGEDLTVGKTLVYALPGGNDLKAYERYLGILAVTGTTTTTAGKINAFLSLDPHGWQAYPEAAIAG